MASTGWTQKAPGGGAPTLPRDEDAANDGDLTPRGPQPRSSGSKPGRWHARSEVQAQLQAAFEPALAVAPVGAPLDGNRRVARGRESPGHSTAEPGRRVAQREVGRFTEEMALPARLAVACEETQACARPEAEEPREQSPPRG